MIMEDNIKKLMDLLKIRLANTSYAKNTNGELVEKNIFTDEQLTGFLEYGLTVFNSVPQFTNITFEDSTPLEIVGIYVVRYAACLALLSQSLVEKGRETIINDDGVQYDPPHIAEFMFQQAKYELDYWFIEVKFAKSDVKKLYNYPHNI